MREGPGKLTTPDGFVYEGGWKAGDGTAGLRRFVRQAAFVTRPDALRASTIEAFSRFSDGAPVALYRREGDGYARAEGEVSGMAEFLDPDTPVLVRMRAELDPAEEDLPAGAALILPLVQRCHRDMPGAMRGWAFTSPPT